MALILTVSVAVTASENRPWAGSYALWSNAARVRPNNWATHYNAGLALLEQKRFDDALVELSRAAELKPDEPDVFDALGRTSDAKGDRTLAISNFKRALAIDHGKFESLNNLGHVYFEIGDYRSAQPYFERALGTRPQTPAVVYNLGLCLSRQGQYADAILRFEQLLNTTPNDGETYYELGMAYEKTGRRADAIGALKRAGELASSQALAEKALAASVRLQKEQL
jgi:tetratricopeptide (TPR) repeat protein